MVADERDGPGEGGDGSGRDSAVSQETNGQYSDLASQQSLHAPTSDSILIGFSSKVSQSIAVPSIDAADLTGKDNVTDTDGTHNGRTVAGETGREEPSKHRRKSMAAPNLSIDTPAMSKRDIVQKPRRSPSSPVSPEPLSQLHSPIHSLRSPSSSRTRERGFSLRRATLARNVHGQPESSGSAIELQSMATSTLQRVPDGSGVGKKSDATITVSPITETRDDLETHVKFPKKVHESLALPHYETWIKSKAPHTGLLFPRLRAAKERVRKKILRIHLIPPSKDGRRIDFDPNRREPLIDERTGRKHIKNTITSSRYTLYNFLPRQLFAQFSKLANFYFLCVSILQMIPGLSTTGTYTTIVPLAFFVFISMAKEGYDDLRRYRLDKAENRKSALVLREHKARATSTDDVNRSRVTPNEQNYWAETKWEEIEVGDVIKLVRDEPAPADLAVLYTHGAEAVAYVETMALDGETNLKSKRALPQLARSCKTIDGITSCKARIVVEDPNLDLYNFEGKVTVGDETLPLANNQIIYRGSVLRNTFEAVGVVVYSGEECKIRMNATKNPRIKAVSTTMHRHRFLK